MYPIERLVLNICVKLHLGFVLFVSNNVCFALNLILGSILVIRSTKKKTLEL